MRQSSPMHWLFLDVVWCIFAIFMVQISTFFKEAATYILGGYGFLLFFYSCAYLYFYADNRPANRSSRWGRLPLQYHVSVYLVFDVIYTIAVLVTGLPYVHLSGPVFGFLIHGGGGWYVASLRDPGEIYGEREKAMLCLCHYIDPYSVEFGLIELSGVLYRLPDSAGNRNSQMSLKDVIRNVVKWKSGKEIDEDPTTIRSTPLGQSEGDEKDGQR